MYYELHLTAGVPYTQDTAGSLLLLDSINGASAVDITLIVKGNEQKTMPGRKNSFKVRQQFDGVIFTAAADCTVGVFLTFTEVSIGVADGTQVSVQGDVAINNDIANPVPVAISGSVSLSATNVGINNNNAAAVPVQQQALSTIVDIAPVVVGTVAGALVHDATLKRLRIRNSHATANVAIGGAGVTLAGSPIQLGPGDVFIEEDAAGADWRAISDTPGATVQLQGLK